MNAMPVTSPAMAALMTAAMMVAMMLPSLAAALWRYRRDLRALPTSYVDARTTLFAAGYAAVWSLVGLLLFAMSMSLASVLALPPAPSSLVVGTLVVSTGALQCSRWKARQLTQCQRSSLSARVQANIYTAWYDGCRFGLRCTASCVAPMTVLLVTGLMNTTMMLLVTAFITAERLLPVGLRIARLTGTLTIAAGAIICLRSSSPAALVSHFRELHRDSFHLHDLRDRGHLPRGIHHSQRDILGGVVPERDRRDSARRRSDPAELPPVAHDSEVVARRPAVEGARRLVVARIREPRHWGRIDDRHAPSRCRAMTFGVCNR